jgi:hypothetical protein
MILKETIMVCCQVVCQYWHGLTGENQENYSQGSLYYFSRNSNRIPLEYEQLSRWVVPKAKKWVRTTNSAQKFHIFEIRSFLWEMKSMDGLSITMRSLCVRSANKHTVMYVGDVQMCSLQICVRCEISLIVSETYEYQVRRGYKILKYAFWTSLLHYLNLLF